VKKQSHLEPIHLHRFGVRNPNHPEGDRCECGMFRYEIMGPLSKHKARMQAFGRPWPVYPR
jgi:hypothetical protein